jgi:hypothetical protein
MIVNVPSIFTLLIHNRHNLIHSNFRIFKEWNHRFPFLSDQKSIIWLIRVALIQFSLAQFSAIVEGQSRRSLFCLVMNQIEIAHRERVSNSCFDCWPPLETLQNDLATMIMNQRRSFHFRRLPMNVKMLRISLRRVVIREWWMQGGVEVDYRMTIWHFAHFGHAEDFLQFSFSCYVFVYSVMLC